MHVALDYAKSLQIHFFCVKCPAINVCVEVLSQSTQWGSCQARSVYLTSHLLGRLSPLSG